MKYGLKPTGIIKVWAKEYNGKMTYSTSISNKKQDGTWENMYISLQIKGEPSNEIEVLDSFLSFFTYKNGKQAVKIVVNEYVNRLEGQDENVEEVMPNGFKAVDEELDF
jgi:hypothetical protein